MKVFIALQITAGLLAAILLTGCAGSTGWRFEIGVSPVKQLDNRAGLTQEVQNESRKAY